MQKSNRIAVFTIAILATVLFWYYTRMDKTPDQGGQLRPSPQVILAADNATGTTSNDPPPIDDLMAKIRQISGEAPATQPAADAAQAAAATGAIPTTMPATVPATMPSTDAASTGGLESERQSLGLPDRPAPHLAVTAASEFKTYTIQAGDTFSSVARKFLGAEKHWSKIAQANPTVDPAKLKIGQVIRIPPSADTDHSPAPGVTEPSDSPSSSSSDSGVTYTVKEGDTLSDIAEQYYNSSAKWKVIYEANRRAIGDDPGRLKDGMKLVIPPAPSPAR